VRRLAVAPTATDDTAAKAAEADAAPGLAAALADARLPVPWTPPDLVLTCGFAGAVIFRLPFDGPAAASADATTASFAVASAARTVGPGPAAALCLVLAQDVCRAVARLHARSIVHGDLGGTGGVVVSPNAGGGCESNGGLIVGLGRLGWAADLALLASDDSAAVDVQAPHPALALLAGGRASDGRPTAAPWGFDGDCRALAALLMRLRSDAAAAGAADVAAPSSAAALDAAIGALMRATPRRSGAAEAAAALASAAGDASASLERGFGGGAAALLRVALAAAV